MYRTSSLEDIFVIIVVEFVVVAFVTSFYEVADRILMFIYSRSDDTLPYHRLDVTFRSQS